MALAKPSQSKNAWQNVLLILTLVNLIGVVGPLAVILLFGVAERLGAGGIGIAALPFAIFLLFGYLVIPINIGVLAFYLLRQRPRGRSLFMAWLVMAICIGIVAFLAWPRPDDSFSFGQPTPTPTLHIQYESQTHAITLIEECSVVRIDRHGDDVRLKLKDGTPQNSPDEPGTIHVQAQSFDAIKEAVGENASECGAIPVTSQD